jgi:predicted enzyme related to lactoylglutathione lyase
MNNDFLPLHGTDYVELYVGNAKQAAHFYKTAFGFQSLAYAGPETGVRDRVSYVLVQNKMRLMLTTPLHSDSPIAEHHKKHGDGVKTLALMERLDPEVCQQVIYFSTASILDRQGNAMKEAGTIGTDYIRTKYLCHQALPDLAIASKITRVYPTLVFGGDKNKPYSHLSGGLKDILRWINLIRWFKADGGFHFIHAQDIAQVVGYLVDHPPEKDDSRDLVLGNAPLNVDQAIAEIAGYLNKKIYFGIPLSIALANFFIKVFRIQMADWDRFCLDYRHFTYPQPTSPKTLGLPAYCSTVAELLQISGIEKP